MWRKKDKVWIHFRQGTVATDVRNALLLETFLRIVKRGKLLDHCVEIADVQRGRIIKKPLKVRQALKEKLDTPFVFAYCKN